MAEQVQAALDWLESHSNQTILDEMGPRYGVHTDKAIGVSMANLKLLAKQLGSSHKLAAGLWDTGWYEARMLAALIDDSAQVTSAQMERWCRDFDNWGICDTVCFLLFDRSPLAFAKVELWATRTPEFEKRAAFALLASLSLHGHLTDVDTLTRGLACIEKAANDDRNFVKKAVNWALRALGERNDEFNAAAVVVAHRLAASETASARWIGKDALRQMDSPAAKRRRAAKTRAAG